MTDKDLINLFLKGDNKAFEKLLIRHEKHIRGMIMSMIKDYDEAQDHFQDISIKIISKINEGKYREDVNFRSWAVTLARNHILDHFRANKKLEQSTDSYSDDDYLNHGNELFDSSFEDDIIRDEILEEWLELIPSLPPEQQQIIELRIYKGLKYKDIAKQSGVCISTAMGRIRYAVNNLRKLYKEKYGHDFDDEENFYGNIDE